MTANVAAYSSSPATKVHNPKMAEITNAPTALIRGMRDCVAGEGGRCRVGIAAGSSLKRRRSHFRPPNGCHFSLGAPFAACRVLKRWSATRSGYSPYSTRPRQQPTFRDTAPPAHLPRHRSNKPTRRNATASSNAVGETAVSRAAVCRVDVCRVDASTAGADARHRPDYLRRHPRTQSTSISLGYRPAPSTDAAPRSVPSKS
jgi:hypothetical protein